MIIVYNKNTIVYDFTPENFQTTENSDLWSEFSGVWKSGIFDV